MTKINKLIRIPLGCESTLESIIKLAQNLNIPFSDIDLVCKDTGFHVENYEPCLEYFQIETDEEYKERLLLKNKLEKQRQEKERLLYEQLKTKFGNNHD